MKTQGYYEQFGWRTLRKSEAVTKLVIDKKPEWVGFVFESFHSGKMANSGGNECHTQCCSAEHFEHAFEVVDHHC